MKIAISQPEHFPYMGFFEKMAAADLFVVLDHVQFSGPRSFQNRNRFLNSNGEMQWFTNQVLILRQLKMLELLQTMVGGKNSSKC